MTVARKKITTKFPEGYNSQHLVGSVQAVALNDFSTSAATVHHLSLTLLWCDFGQLFYQFHH